MQPTCKRFNKTNTLYSDSCVNLPTSVCPLLSTSPLLPLLLLAAVWTLHLESRLGTHHLAVMGYVM
jgi:hypothetical protein